MERRIAQVPDILVRRVPASIVNALKRRATRHRRSLQSEVVDILATAAGSDRTPAQIAGRIRARLLRTGASFADSTSLIRGDRQR
ncbi:MAG: FitA-like ribbon-helix-helix domain-containing protein [bacterium]